jgi:hypothetical protein
MSLNSTPYQPDWSMHMRMGLHHDDAPHPPPFSHMLLEITWKRHFVNDALVVVEGVTWPPRSPDLSVLQFFTGGSP